MISPVKDRKSLLAHQRFERYLNRRGEGDRGCWQWRGALNRYGHGRFMIGSRKDGTRRQESAHRFAYRFYVGPIPAGARVFPKCGHPQCVSPGHLKLGTQGDVVRWAVQRGTWTQGRHLPVHASHPGERNGRVKLTQEAVNGIRLALAAGELPKNLARSCQVTLATISAIKHHKTWKPIECNT